MDHDIIIIGAGCAGLTAAIYAARAGKRVLILESEGIGGQIATSPKVENYPGIKSISGIELSDALFEQASELGVDLELEKVLSIRKDNDIFTVETDFGSHAAKTCIIATGVKPRKLGLADEERLEGKGVSYCAVCDGAFYKDRDVAVVGGGSTALQSALMLSDICRTVYLIHRRSGFRAEQVLAERVKSRDNIKLVLDSTISALNGKERLEEIEVAHTNGEKQSLAADCLFVLIGKIADNGAFAELVDLDEKGYIIADESCRTKTPGLFVAGDCRTKEVRQLTTAAADGSAAALAAIES